MGQPLLPEAGEHGFWVTLRLELWDPGVAKGRGGDTSRRLEKSVCQSKNCKELFM